MKLYFRLFLSRKQNIYYQLSCSPVWSSMSKVKSHLDPTWKSFCSLYIGSADASEQSKEFVPEISVRGYLIGGHRTSGCLRGVLQGQEEGGKWLGKCHRNCTNILVDCNDCSIDMSSHWSFLRGRRMEGTSWLGSQLGPVDPATRCKLVLTTPPFHYQIWTGIILFVWGIFGFRRMSPLSIRSSQTKVGVAG